MEAYGKYSPHVLDYPGVPMWADGEELNGYKGFLGLNFKAYDVKGNLGVTCYLYCARLQEAGAWIDDTYSVGQMLKDFG